MPDGMCRQKSLQRKLLQLGHEVLVALSPYQITDSPVTGYFEVDTRSKLGIGVAPIANRGWPRVHGIPPRLSGST